MKPRVCTLRLSIRGNDGESVHALVAKMQRRRTWGVGAARWKLVGLYLRRGTQRRDIPLHRVNRTQLDELSVMAERQTGAAYHD